MPGIIQRPWISLILDRHPMAGERRWWLAVGYMNLLSSVGCCCCCWLVTLNRTLFYNKTSWMGGVPKQGVLSTGLRKHLLELCDYTGTTYTVLACTQLLHLFTLTFLSSTLCTIISFWVRLFIALFINRRLISQDKGHIPSSWKHGRR